MPDSEISFLEQLKARQNQPEAPKNDLKKLSEVVVGNTIVLGFQEAPNKLTIVGDDEFGDISTGKVTKSFFLRFLSAKTPEERDLIARNNGFSPE